MEEALDIGRRLVEIGDAALRRCLRVGRKMGAPNDAFISPDRAEFVPIGK
jgi:hypothetical protein